MKAIILAAGYATRLYPITENTPKPLLLVRGVSILDRLMQDIDTIEEVDEHIVVCNHKFVNQFEYWKAHCGLHKPVRIIDDGSMTNETRLGAVRDLLLAIEKCSIDEDVLVLAADNILDFSFKGFVEYAKRVGTSCIMRHHEPEIAKLQRTGVIRIDEEERVLEMQEKPEVPCSHWAVPPFYYYAKQDLPLIKESVANGCAADAPGSLARYLLKKTVLHAWEMSGSRMDIGNLETYYRVRG